MDACRLLVHAFNSPADPLVKIGDIPQAIYLRHYFADLHAQSVLEETAYFDRDYLSEYAVFYTTDSEGNLWAFCYVAFDADFGQILQWLKKTGWLPTGGGVHAF
ncbi:MAG: hypothetical protein HY719_11990 [Planctomycetes bacterium]|nr:hypothetical protein [Planctomycetota bacterium]